MEHTLFGVEPFFVLTYLVTFSLAAAGIGYKMLKFLQLIDRRGMKQNTALIEMADHTDNEGKRLHPDRSPNLIKPTIERILKED